MLSETLNVDDEIAATADEAPRFDAGAPDTLPPISEPGTGGVGDPTNPTGTSSTKKPN